jgi:hypothetical protein
MSTANENDYNSEIAKQFIRETRSAGFDPEHYHGRFFWQGPAVRADHVSEVMSVTSVPCQSDSMGLGVIVYPVQSAKRKEKEERL